LALVGFGPWRPVEDASNVRHLLVRGVPGALPLVVSVSDTTAQYGYASHLWAVDLLRWSYMSAPAVQRDRIIGLSLGYGTDAVRAFRRVHRYSQNDIRSGGRCWWRSSTPTERA
jgi:hypothetical protein